MVRAAKVAWTILNSVVNFRAPKVRNRIGTSLILLTTAPQMGRYVQGGSGKR